MNMVIIIYLTAHWFKALLSINHVVLRYRDGQDRFVSLSYMYIHGFTNTSTAVNILQHFCKYRKKGIAIGACLLVYSPKGVHCLCMNSGTHLYPEITTLITEILFQYFFYFYKNMADYRERGSWGTAKIEPLIMLMSCITHFSFP